MYEFMGQVDDDESAGFKVVVPHSFNPASFCWPRNSFLGKIFGSSKDALAIKKSTRKLSTKDRAALSSREK